MQDRVVREPECELITGLSRTTRWRKENKNPPEFPKRIKISENASGWLLSRLNDWLKAVAEGRPYDPENGTADPGLEGRGYEEPEVLKHPEARLPTNP